jgi:hypothetical protein
MVTVATILAMVAVVTVGLVITSSPNMAGR